MDGRILPGQVAWYVTGRFYASEDNPDTAFDAGYFVHLQGIDAPLFSGAPGEGTAYLTFLAEPFKAEKVYNGDITLGLDPVGEFGVYLNRTAGASFDNPQSFGAGTMIARFRRVSVVMGATVGAGAANQALFSANVFSAQLIRSREFELGGRRYDLGRLIPNGVTQWGTAAVTSTGTPAGVPFVGSAIAIGGEPLRG
jgi:hypothetical protein